MVEIWWKVFLFGFAIAVVLKLAGVPASFPMLFLAAAVFVFLVIVVAMAIHNAHSRRNQSK